MTREQFVEEYNEMWQLKEFVSDHEIWDVLDDVYDAESYRDWVWDNIRDWCDSWESLGSWLYNLPESDEYDYYDLSDEPCGVGDWETSYWKQQVLDEADHRDLWDDDDEETFEIEEAPAEPPKADDTEFIMLLTAYAN